MWGDSESASKNTSDSILKIRKERFLIFPLACDLVLARLTISYEAFSEMLFASEAGPGPGPKNLL